MRLRWLLWPAAALSGLLLYRQLARALSDPPPPLATVPDFELARYLGRWYEIARLPVAFEAGCSGVTAEYFKDFDGTLRVFNRCRAPEGPREILGTARVPDPREPAKLEVRFFGALGALLGIRGDYWILGLGAQYEWALVGSPDRKTLWLLSRTPQLGEAARQEALGIADRAGFPLAQLLYTEQP